MINSNTENISALKLELKQAIESQAQSNNGLSESIIDLNISLAKLTNSLEYRDRDVQEIKAEVKDVQSRLTVLERKND